MRITYRPHEGTRAYWQDRWERIPPDAGTLNLARYPGKFAEEAVRLREGAVLEAGCGAGRVLLHYYRRDRKIVGMDFISLALKKIRTVESRVPLVAGDVTKLPFSDRSFSVVLAFGLYHNLESGLDLALRETRRIMESGGILCASFRADNIQNRVLDLVEARKLRGGEKVFHKANYAAKELKGYMAGTKFSILNIRYVENMPFLYKFPIFRHGTHKEFKESVARIEGYRLSFLGSLIQRLLITMPASFSNTVVITAKAE